MIFCSFSFEVCISIFATSGAFIQLWENFLEKVVAGDCDKTTILSVKMQNEVNIEKFVLGFGVDCEVLEPEWLKNKLMGTLVEIIRRYDINEDF